MRLSREKCVALSHLLLKALEGHPGTEVIGEPNRVRLGILQVIERFLKEDDAAAENARRRIASMKRGIVEGSEEWDILFAKYYREETDKKRKVRG